LVLCVVRALEPQVGARVPKLPMHWDLVFTEEVNEIHGCGLGRRGGIGLGEGDSGSVNMPIEVHAVSLAERLSQPSTRRQCRPLGLLAREQSPAPSRAIFCITRQLLPARALSVCSLWSQSTSSPNHSRTHPLFSSFFHIDPSVNIILVMPSLPNQTLAFLGATVPEPGSTVCTTSAG